MKKKHPGERSEIYSKNVMCKNRGRPCNRSDNCKVHCTVETPDKDVMLLSCVYTGPAFGSSGGIIPSRIRTFTGRALIERLHTHVKLFAVPGAIYGMGLKQLRYTLYSRV